MPRDQHCHLEVMAHKLKIFAMILLTRNYTTWYIFYHLMPERENSLERCWDRTCDHTISYAIASMKRFPKNKSEE